VLVDIPGLGEQKARLLLRKFGSVKRLKLASEAEITQLPGFSQRLANIVIEHLAD
jgi:excinuclease ABC subunit C